MPKTYLQQVLENLPIPTEKVTEELKNHLRLMLEESGFNPDDEIDFAAMGFETFTCSICGKEITDEPSNNAEPVNSGRCCNKCNREVVIPARMKK